MNNLVRTQIVDKNGKLTTRWMKSSGYSHSNYIPAPVPVERVDSPLPRGAVKEMKEIKSSLVESLAKELEDEMSKGYSYTHGENYRASLNLINEAVASRDYEKTKVYSNHMSVTFDPQHLSSFVDHLKSQGYEGISEGLTSEKMEGFMKFSKKVRTYTLGGFPETIKDLTKEARDDLTEHAGELMFTNEGMEDRIYSLVVDHGITDPDQLTAALHESDRINTPFFGGIL